VTSSLSHGKPWPLGAQCSAEGVNFAVFSANAQAIELCIFDDSGEHQTLSIFLPKRTNDVWHGFVSNLGEGTVYGLRAHGEFDQRNGHRFDAAKTLLDPYAKDVVQSKDGDFRARVIKSEDDRVSALASKDSTNEDRIIYELHIKGFSKSNNALPEALRGTYAGLAHPTSIKYLKDLGVTALSLLPVHYCFDETRLSKLGLSNYWGYNTLAFFCPNPKYASSNYPRAEFKAMVQALHQANIEVLLDVVYNHTAESDEFGPTLSFRGLDNASYYRLPKDDLSKYENFAGCGNTLDVRQPQVLQLITDSLRYWVSEMGVDGFRFDLAPILGRQAGEQGNDFTGQATFFQTIAQDPVLSRIKMIAEPWDIATNGYQVGNFPSGWGEWNDQFRDTMRSFWLHRGTPEVSRAAFAMRLCGSADTYQKNNRRSADSVNFVVAHDGFTLRDAVSYEHRHNEANGENNRDGHSHNLSVNCGVEGDTNDANILALRARLQRSLIASTLLSLGTPMLCAGDELGHSQQGNNNPYCQDNETTWIDWQTKDDALIEFTRNVIGIRNQLKPLGKDWGSSKLTWLTSNGDLMSDADWHSRHEHSLACLIERGSTKNTLLLIFNPKHNIQNFQLPIQNVESNWWPVLDSALPNGVSAVSTPFRETLEVTSSTLMLLELIPNQE
jgi:glycogen debranching enzyme GlgX